MPGVLVRHIDRRAGHVGAGAAVREIGERLDLVPGPVGDHGTGTEMIVVGRNVIAPQLHGELMSGNLDQKIRGLNPEAGPLLDDIG